MRRTNLFVITSLLPALLAFSGCGHKPESRSPQPLPTASVRVQNVESRKRMATEEVVGTVRPKLRSVIEAKVSGRVERMLVAPGQSVRSGDLLLQLNATEIQARYEQARAVREQAEREFKRKEALFKDKTISQAEFDIADAQFRVAEASVKEAETLLGYIKVVAPFDGLITAKRADVGDLAAPGKPLLEMEDPTTLRLEADVPEALMGKIALGDKLSVRMPALDAALEGTVSEIAPVADANSRTFPVKLDLPIKTKLRSGQFGRLAVPVAEVNAIRVPVSAVILRGQMELAFVVANGKAQMRLVKTGKHLGSELEIVAGLNAGEQIVVENTSQLMDGQPVEIRR
jgi:RND family efflux transporter MFP subunit